MTVNETNDPELSMPDKNGETPKKSSKAKSGAASKTRSPKSKASAIKSVAEPDAPAAASDVSTAETPKKRRAPRSSKTNEKIAHSANDVVSAAAEAATATEAEKPKRRTRRKPSSEAPSVTPDETTQPDATLSISDAPEDSVTKNVKEAVAVKPEPKRRSRARAKEKIASEAKEITTAQDAIEPEPPTDSPLPAFDTLGLSAPLLRAIEEIGYKTPTPIQARAIPVVLQKRDVLGVAQTGTGKTASFTLPMLELLSGSRARARMPRSLILEPTRELALQVSENLTSYGKHLKLNHALLIGGESMADQRAVLNQGVDILIATPGRLMDLFERGGLLLTQANILVIDEADRMLDMGFIPDIQRITSLLPARRQTLFFSATMAPEIRSLADQFLSNPEEITVSRPSSVATTIEEALLIVNERDKRRTLRTLLNRENVQNAIVFCNRKRDVDILQKSLHRHQFSVGHLHGDLHQATRFKTLDQFKNNEIKILVCSDVAARGIDIGGLSHVFNFDLPFNAEDYVHRIGRTGRAGRMGHAFSLATPGQKGLLDAIEQLTGKKLPQPQIEGVETVDWSDERTGQGRNGHQKDRPARQSARTSDDSAAKSDQRREPRRRHHRDERELPAPEADHEGPGFGASTPNFMNAPRRKTPPSSGQTSTQV